MITIPTSEDIIESFSEAVIAIGASPAMEVAYFNQSAEQLTEMSRARAVGKGFDSIFFRDPWLVDITRDTLKDGRLHTDYEETLHRWFSSPVRVKATTSRILDPLGVLCGVSIIIRDTSGIKAIEAQDLRKDRLAYLGTFAAKLAHEVRNPLSGIRGAAQLVDRMITEPEVKEFSTLIISEVDRLSAIVKEMLNFTGAGELRLRPVNIHILLDQVVLILSKGKTAKAVTKGYDPSLPPVLADSGQLMQVFINLLRNARQAGAEDGNVSVLTRIATDFHLGKAGAPGSKFVLVEIRDNGGGISKEILDKMFTPFFSTRPGGSGLGMSISLSIVKAHNGFMKVVSTPGEGTSVFVYIPTCKETQ